VSEAQQDGKCQVSQSRWSKHGEPEEGPLDAERLARLWLEQARETPTEEDAEDEEWEWVSPVERLHQLVYEDGRAAWRVILRLIELADASSLPSIGAGPLEDLLREHGSVVIADAERLAAVDSRFRYALSCVWGWASMSEDLLARISRAVGRT
jgi:hypothetical protein